MSQSFQVSPQDEVFGSVGFTFTRGHVENTISRVTLRELRACPSTGDAKREVRTKPNYRVFQIKLVNKSDPRVNSAAGHFLRAARFLANGPEL